MKKSYIIDYYSPDIDLQSFNPQPHDDFAFVLQLFVGIEGGKGEECFDIFVCTPKWIEHNYAKQTIISGLHTIIVQEYDFEKLKEWVRTMRFERMGAFIYSEEEGTYAAKNYTDDIPTKTKERRLDELMQIQQEISTEILSKMVGSKQKVIIDREEDSFYVGRTQYDSPDVDCEVLITKVPNIEIGKFYDVTITKADEFDLYATL